MCVPGALAPLLVGSCDTCCAVLGPRETPGRKPGNENPSTKKVFVKLSCKMERMHGLESPFSISGAQFPALISEGRLRNSCVTLSNSLSLPSYSLCFSIHKLRLIIRAQISLAEPLWESSLHKTVTDIVKQQTSQGSFLRPCLSGDQSFVSAGLRSNLVPLDAGDLLGLQGWAPAWHAWSFNVVCIQRKDVWDCVSYECN